VAGIHFLLQVPVGGSDNANAHLTSAILANPFKLALLQNAEQFGLQLQRNFGDLIEEQRAAVSELKPAHAVASRARERTFRVTEELAFEELARDGSASPVAAIMKRPGNEFLSCP
jgi:hypothetical protein